MNPMLTNSSKDTARHLDLDLLQPGMTAACNLYVGETEVNAFAQLSGDDNPLHLDDAYAQDCGFSGRVAHGMLALAAISRLIGTQLPGPGSLWLSQEFQFVAPVFVGDTIEARVTVQSVSRAARIVVLETSAAQTESNRVVLRGMARVRVPVREFGRRGGEDEQQ